MKRMPHAKTQRRKEKAARYAMKLRAVLNGLAPFLILLGILGLFALLPTPEGEPVRHFFLSGDNFRLVASQWIVIALGTVGMALILLSGGIDLSAGASAALAGVVAAMLLGTGHSLSTALLAALITGGVIGALNGTFVATLGVAPFLVTLGMIGVARGAARLIGGAAPIPLADGLWIYDWTAPFPALSWLKIAPGVWVVLLVAGVLALVLRGTVFGRHLYAVGSNETAAILCGVRTRLTKGIAYMLGGLFFGLAGAVQMATSRQGDPAAASGLELDFIAAAVIGGIKLGGGSGHLFGALFGALIMTILRNGCQQAGWPVPMQQIVIGLAIIAVVGLDQWRRRGTASR